MKSTPFMEIDDKGRERERERVYKDIESFGREIEV
jgi:hypothetical protein